MNFSDQVQIVAPIEEVWSFLLDPQKVGGCAPGVESVDIIDDQHFEARVKVGIAQFRAKFTLNIEMIDVDPPSEAAVQVRGHAPGTAVDATARMHLTALDGGTLMKWEADVTVSGRLAAIGNRLVEWTANKLIGQTFQCIKARLES